MKVLRKKHLISTGAIEGTMVEREVLRSVRHPFIVSLHYAFQTDGNSSCFGVISNGLFHTMLHTAKLYLVMDYMNGGQLFFHLREEAMFSEDLVPNPLMVIYQTLRPLINAVNRYDFTLRKSSSLWITYINRALFTETSR